MLNRGLYRELRRDGVRLGRLGAGRTRGRTAVLPAGAGTVAPAEGGADAGFRGGIALRSGRRIAKLHGLGLDTRTGRLTGRIGKRRLAIALLGGVSGKPAGFGTKISAATLRLTGKAAALLNRGLGLRRTFKANRSLGSLVTVLQPGTVRVSSGTISIGGPDTAFSKLRSLDVEMGGWGASGRWSSGEETYFLFSTEPTEIATDATAGIVAGAENDGISMEIHAPPPRNMLLRQPRIDLATGELSATLSPLSTESPVTAAIGTLDYGAATVQVRPGVGVFELTGIQALANQFIADRLNESFRTPGLFQAGETLARVTMTLRTR